MYKLNDNGTYANKVGTGEWHNTQTSEEYLKWLEEGNEVLPAVEPPVDEPPVDEPPAVEPPVDEPPVDEPPADEPPADEVVE
jgi:hypothetical protein